MVDPDSPDTEDRPSMSGTGASGDWAAEATAKIESLVTTVRSYTSDRLVHAARVVVFGILACTMALMALILGLIAAIRLLDVALPGKVWLPYLVLGTVFLLLAGVLWSKRTAPTDRI